MNAWKAWSRAQTRAGTGISAASSSPRLCSAAVLPRVAAAQLLQSPVCCATAAVMRLVSVEQRHDALVPLTRIICPSDLREHAGADHRRQAVLAHTIAACDITPPTS